MTDQVDHKRRYAELEAQNPVAAARYLQQHGRDIYPEQPPAVSQLPTPATRDDVDAARAYVALDAANPVRAAQFMESRKGAVVRGLEAIRGRRPMPPNDNNNPPPQAA